MPREKLALYRNDIISKYRNGSAAAAIGRELGVTTTTVTRILKGAGVMKHTSRGESMRRPDESRILSLFQAGIAPSDIQRQTGASKSGLYAILRRHGATLRGHSRDELSESEKRAFAMAREKSGALNASEQSAHDLLVAAGFDVKPQFAIGTGNIDLVLTGPAVAVEVSHRGTFNMYVRNGWFSKRIRDCADLGLHTYVMGGRDASDITDHAVQDVIAWAQFLDRSPTSRRQYRVVWGGTELLATGCSDDDEITIETPARYASKVADRKNER